MASEDVRGGGGNRKLDPQASTNPTGQPGSRTPRSGPEPEHEPVPADADSVLQKIKELVLAENPIDDLKEVLGEMKIVNGKITPASLNAMSTKLDGKLQKVNAENGTITSKTAK